MSESNIVQQKTIQCITGSIENTYTFEFCAKATTNAYTEKRKYRFENFTVGLN